eukprot:140590_1
MCTALLIIGFLINLSVSEIILPTYSNLTHEFFSNITGNINQTNTIRCSANHCYIICDKTYIQYDVQSCHSLTIDGTMANTLNIQCTAEQSCRNVFINASDVMMLDMECTGKDTCRQLQLNGPTFGGSLTIKCISTSACKEMIINSMPNANIFIYSTGLYAFINSKINASNATNIYFECNGAVSCQWLELNAPYSSFVSIKCIQSSCVYNKYYLQYSKSVQFDAQGTNAFSVAEFYLDYVTDAVNFTCSGGQSCASYIFAANLRNNININCVSSYACSGINLECPINHSCNIKCLFINACHISNFKIPVRTYAGFNLQCANVSSSDGSNAFCRYVDIICLDTGFVSDIIYDPVYPYWDCKGFGCCPKSTATVTCPSEADVYINCSLIKCERILIDCRLANTLTIDCIDTSCMGTNILCPIGNSTSCNVYCIGNNYTSCSYLLIQRYGDNILDNFSLVCDGIHGNVFNENSDGSVCSYVVLTLNSADINNLSLSCTGNYSCTGSVFNIRSRIIDKFYLSCLSCDTASVNILSDVTFINSFS